jgi:hypothetical protein
MLKILLIGFCVAGLALASAVETYHVTLPDAMVVNGTLLKAGTYTVRVEGDKAVFVHGKQKAETPVKVEQSPKKFESTIFKSDNTGHGLQLSEIRISGTRTKLLLQAN